MQRQPVAAGTSGAAHTVHVHIGLNGQLVADHRGQFLGVEPARGHVGGDQCAATAVGEAYQNFVALSLLDIAVQRQYRVAAPRQPALDFLRILARVAEHQRRLRTMHAQQMRQRIQAASRIDFVKCLLHCR